MRGFGQSVKHLEQAMTHKDVESTEIGQEEAGNAYAGWEVMARVVGAVLGRNWNRSERLITWVIDIYDYAYSTGVAHPSVRRCTVQPGQVVGARDVELFDLLNSLAELVVVVDGKTVAEPIRAMTPLIIKRISEELLARSTKRGTINQPHPGWRL